MRQVRAAAWLAAGLNAAGLCFAVAGMRPGAPGAPLEARLQFLAAAPLGWTLGWGVWMLAALAVVVFFTHLARAVRGQAGLLGLALVAMGAAVDLLCDVVQLTVIPQVAAAALTDPGGRALFLALDRGLWAGGVVVACGLYCLGVAVVTQGLARDDLAPKPLRAASLCTLLGGAVWIAAELLLARAVLPAATAVTVGAFMVWALLVPRALEGSDGRGA